MATFDLSILHSFLNFVFSLDLYVNDKWILNFYICDANIVTLYTKFRLWTSETYSNLKVYSIEVYLQLFWMLN